MIGSFSAMYQDRVYISNVLRLGTARQGNKTEYTSAVFQDWESLSRIKKEKCLSDVKKWGTSQQCNKTGNPTAIFQDWEHLSNVI